MRIYTFIEKCVQTAIFLFFFYGLTLLGANDSEPDISANIFGAMLGMMIGTMVPVYFFYYLAGLCEALRNPLFAEFLKHSGKDILSFMFVPGLYLKDAFSWLAAASFWLIILNGETPSVLLLCCIIFYPFISVFAYPRTQTSISAEEQPGSRKERTLFPKPAGQDLSQKPARSDLSQKPPCSDLSQKQPCSDLSQKPPCSDLSDAKREQHPASEKLKETAEYIATFIPLIENKSLAENVKTISATMHQIADFAASKKSQKEIQECLNNAFFYAEEFYNMLVSYDEIANSSLRIKEGDRLMQSVENFAEDLSSALVKMLERAISPDLLESKGRIAALRKEIRMKGLHTG